MNLKETNQSQADIGNKLLDKERVCHLKCVNP